MKEIINEGREYFLQNQPISVFPIYIFRMNAWMFRFRRILRRCNNIYSNYSLFFFLFAVELKYYSSESMSVFPVTIYVCIAFFRAVTILANSSVLNFFFSLRTIRSGFCTEKATEITSFSTMWTTVYSNSGIRYTRELLPFPSCKNGRSSICNSYIYQSQ